MPVAISKQGFERLGPRQILFVNVVGTLAAILSSVSLFPQVYETATTRDVSGLSFGTVLIIATTSLLWLVYHYMLGTFHGALAGAFNLTSSLILVYYIVTLRKTA